MAVMFLVVDMDKVGWLEKCNFNQPLWIYCYI